MSGSRLKVRLTTDWKLLFVKPQILFYLCQWWETGATGDQEADNMITSLNIYILSDYYSLRKSKYMRTSKETRER